MASAGRCLWTTSGTGGRGGRHSPIFKLPWESVAIHTNGPPQISLWLTVVNDNSCEDKGCLNAHASFKNPFFACHCCFVR